MEISHAVFIICCHFTLILNAQNKTKADDTVSVLFLKQRSKNKFVYCLRGKDSSRFKFSSTVRI